MIIVFAVVCDGWTVSVFNPASGTLAERHYFTLDQCHEAARKFLTLSEKYR